MDDFAIFILTHGRANEQITLNTLYDCGYSGAWYLICDDMDEQLDEYKDKYGDKVIVFDKKKVAENIDTMDNFNNLKTVVYARNACFDIAKSLGLKYFAMFDDDIKSIAYRYEESGKLRSKPMANIDGVIEGFIEFLKLPQIGSLSLGSQNCYIGGLKGKFKDGLAHNLNQIMFVKTDTPLEFCGTLNEDLNAMCLCSAKGLFNWAVVAICQTSPKRASNAGGLHELYNETNSYSRSFYSVIMGPSYTKLKFYNGEFTCMTSNNMMHPKILNQRWKK